MNEHKGPRERTPEEIAAGAIPEGDYKPTNRLNAEEMAAASYDQLAEVYGITPQEARERVNFGDYMNMLADTVAPTLAQDPGEYPRLKKGLIGAMIGDGIKPESDEYRIIMDAFIQMSKGAVKPMVPRDQTITQEFRAKKAEITKKTQETPSANLDN